MSSAIVNFMRRTLGRKAPPEATPALSGRIEACEYRELSGWVIDRRAVSVPATIEIFMEDEKLGEVLADQPRFDLADASTGRLPMGFRFAFPEGRRILFWMLSVRFKETGEPLAGSPLEWDEPTLNEISVAFDDLAEEPDPDHLPPLDRPDCDEAALSPNQRFWRENGYLILERFLPEDLVDSYREARWRLRPHWRGWQCPTPFLHVPEMMALASYKPLAEVLEELIGAPMGLHLALTHWRTTNRDWHQDDYLNPGHVHSWYAAVWMALEDIDPDSGPFELVPGSHRWPLLRSDKVKAALPDTMRRRADWPNLANRFVAPACEREIARRGAEVQPFLAKKGDVLIWHGRLLHRGSPAADPERMRRALICHYSAIDHRPDFEPARQSEHGGWYFPFDYPLDAL